MDQSDSSSKDGDNCRPRPCPVVYSYSQKYSEICSTFEREKYRATLVHDLIKAYGLFDHMRIMAPKPCGPELLKFHCSDYLKMLELASNNPQDFSEEELDQFGLGYDCPVLPGVHEYALLVAGATLECAKALAAGDVQLAFNWGGGWHHATRFAAAGFCYINDCVVGILELKKTFKRVLYLDLDIHHGDGVEDAFSCTDSVVTLSFHLKEPGFFPGTGCVTNFGQGRGRFCSLNFPLLSGASDSTFITAFDGIVPTLIDRFSPEVIVVQFGADGLSMDPLGGLNLTNHSYVYVAKYLRNVKIPLLILGGGGYNRVNVAKCWTSITAEFLGINLHEDIPEHQNFTSYKPDYVLSVKEGQRSDLNSEEYIKQMSEKLIGYISNL